MQKLPWYGNNAYLQQFYDSLSATFNGNPAYRVEGTNENVYYRIPVKFWVFNDSNKGVFWTLQNPEVTLKTAMWSLNEAFRRNNVPIRFYMLCPEYIEDKKLGSESASSFYLTFTSRYNTTGALNVRIINKFSDPRTGGQYNRFDDAVTMRRDLMNYKDFPEPGKNVAFGTFIHEVGHWLGLDHTHQFYNVPCIREPVTRGMAWGVCNPIPLFLRRCEVTGDALCDTEADRMLQNYPSNVVNCTWIPGPRDDRGDLYRPDVSNYMSYAEDACVNKFSVGQRTIMVRKASIRSAFGIIYPTYTVKANNDFDIYEPDDTDKAASPIALNETQIHNLSTIYSQQYCEDNSDWLSYTHSDSGLDVFIDIIDVAGHYNPVLEVEVWNSDPTKTPREKTTRGIATLVSNAGTKFTYKIPCISLASGITYLIRVVRNGGTLGRYQVKMRGSALNLGSYGIPIIADPANNGCLNTTKRYYINLASLPAGNNPTIKWIAHSGLQILPGTPDNQTYVDVQFTANVAYGILRVDTKSTSACFADGMGTSIVRSSLPSNYAVNITSASVALCLGNVVQYSYIPPPTLPANTGGLVSILWTGSSNLQISNETTATPTITAITNGASTISVQITHFDSCFGYNYGISSLTLWVGIPPRPPKSIIYTGVCQSAYILPTTGATDISIDGEPFMPIISPFYLPEGSYMVSLSNSCGATVPRAVTILVIDPCKIVGQTPKEPIISVLPNPANTYLDVANILAGSEVKIYNKMGILVHSEKSENDYIRLDISKLNTDLYILEAVLPNRQKVRKQIIKE